MPAPTIALYVLGGLLLVAGLIGLAVPVIPGAALLVLGVVLLAWAEDFTRIGWGTVIAAGVVGALIMAADAFTAVWGAKLGGASRWGMAGALIGLVAGMPFGIAGVILGPPIGAVALEYFKNPRWKDAARAGAGVLAGYVAGLVLKFGLAGVLIGIVLVALFL